MRQSIALKTEIRFTPLELQNNSATDLKIADQIMLAILFLAGSREKVRALDFGVRGREFVDRWWIEKRIGRAT